jgi:RNA-directed DNA polymerase
MTSKKQVERYRLQSSPFYRMGRAVDLAALLHLSPKQLTGLIVRRQALYLFREETINGKIRSLAVPIGEMRRVHDRMKALLGRIVLPSYLYSPRRGKAPLDNAVAHMSGRSVVKLDIKQFYPSTTDEHVFQFFHHRLGMADDVAGRLTKLCTVNGKVPFGSPLSPILCALVHDDVFSRAATLCQLDGDTMSLWVDDLTISGDDVGQHLLRSIRRMLMSKRLPPHKSQRVQVRRGVVITGTFISPRGPAPANKSHLKMRDKLNELQTTASTGRQLEIARSLIGMVNHQMTIFPKDSNAHARLRARLAWLHNLRRQLEEPRTLTQESTQSPDVVVDSIVPWD